MNKLLIIDGNSIMNRAFYGLPLLTDAQGRYTNAVYGFLNILLRTIDDEQPSHVVVAFDSSAPTFRHKVYDAYKGNRKGMPDELRPQMALVKEVLSTMNICTYEEKGIEADDILGTLSLQFENQGEVTVLSGDRDLLQLASDKTKVMIPRTKGGETTTESYTYASFVDTYGFTPTQFIDVKGMMGDSSDNIPGIPGVGEKTAHKYIKKYASLEGLYEHVDDLKGKTKEKVVDNKELAFLSKELATIKRDCPIPLDVKHMQMEHMFNEKAFEFFKDLNFTRLLTRFDFNEMEVGDSDIDFSIQVYRDAEEFLSAIKEPIIGETVAFHLYQDDCMVEVSLQIRQKKTDVRFLLELKDQSLSTEWKEQFLSYLKEAEDLLLYDVKQIAHQMNLNPEHFFEHFEDLHLMYYLAKPNKSDYPLLDLGLTYTNVTLHNLDELMGKGRSKIAFCDVDEEKRHNYMAQSVTILMDSYKPLMDVLAESSMLGLYNVMEKPLLGVLYHMEYEGIHVDTEVLRDLSDEMGTKIDTLTSQIYELAGEEFNINSPKQLGVILFEKMGLPVIKKTKTGYSTNVDVLEKLKSESPIIGLLLQYRQLTKLKSTYTDGLFGYVKEDGRIHSTFNQTIASTGRLSSTDPNLQNIPIRMEEGRRIRKAFIPKTGHVFIDADYSQIELRILAHLSEDERFIEAFRSEADIHRLTASQVFHVPFEEVTPALRRNAKAVNFGIVYGISDYGLSQDLDIPVKEAKEYIEAYFANYEKVKAFLDVTVAQAYADGYVTTLYNRRRIIPELSSSNYMTRQFGERIAMNTPIQGTAADIIKIAMIKVEKRLKKEQLQAKLILQVHDELIIEAPTDEMERVKALLVEEMEGAVSLSVPLTVDVQVADNWYEAK